MSRSPPPAKRARLSYDAQTATAPTATVPLQTSFERHSNFWFDDGNLILVAKGNIAFRIYRGFLTAQPTFFADKITSASSDPNRLFDECPVVEVSDTPEELAHFLRIVLPRSKQMYVLISRYLDAELRGCTSGVIGARMTYHSPSIKLRPPFASPKSTRSKTS